MKKIIFTVGTGSCALLLSACSYFTSTSYWNFQKITLQTQPSGARCNVINEYGNWVVQSTPHTFVVHRSKTPLQVICYKPGYLPATKSIPSVVPLMRKGELEPNYYPSEALYNYDYPRVISLTLQLAPPVVLTHPVTKNNQTNKKACKKK